MSVFKNYEPGEPTCRLYVKNIAKQVEEKVGTFIALDPLWFTGYMVLYSGVFIYCARQFPCHHMPFCVIQCQSYILQWCFKMTLRLFVLIFIICLPGPEVHLWEICQPFVRSREKHVCKQQST